MLLPYIRVAQLKIFKKGKNKGRNIKRHSINYAIMIPSFKLNSSIKLI